MAVGVGVAVFVRQVARVKILAGNLNALDDDLVGHADVVSLGAHLELGHEAEPRVLVRLLVEIDLEIATNSVLVVCHHSIGGEETTNLASSVDVVVGEERTYWPEAT